jgi:hypothetical protein
MRILTKERITKSATRYTHKMEQKKLYSIFVSLFFLGKCLYVYSVSSHGRYTTRNVT